MDHEGEEEYQKYGSYRRQYPQGIEDLEDEDEMCLDEDMDFEQYK